MSNAETKPVVGQIEDHFAAGSYQPCRWNGSAWVPVKASAKARPASGRCSRCGTYCYGDCRC